MLLGGSKPKRKSNLFPKNKADWADWFIDYAHRVPYDTTSANVQKFIHCCGGREIGGFSRMIGQYQQYLRKLAEAQSKDRDIYVNYLWDELGNDEANKVRKAIIKAGIRTQLRGVSSLSTIVATTTNSRDQLIAAGCLEELGFKDVLMKRNSNSNNQVKTWVFVGDGTLL